MASNNTTSITFIAPQPNGSPSPVTGAATFTPVDLQWVELFQKGFVGDILACISIALAIISTPDADGTEPPPLLPCSENNFTPMPDDFIPQVNVMKPIPLTDPTPVEDRFGHLQQVLDKRPVGAPGEKEVRGDKSTFPQISMDQFQDRLRALRQGVVKWGAARIEAYFVAQTNREYPDLKINGRAIESSADFCDWIKKGPWNNEMRGIVFFASGTLWGDNNQWAVNMEIEFCKMLQIKFTGLKSNNKKLQRLHKGKCIAATLVKGKGSLVGKFRNTCKRKYLEAIYCRTEKPKIGGSAGKGDGTMSVPRMVLQEDARMDTHGFIGKLAKCEGHPDASAPTEVVTKSHTSPSASSTGTMSTLEETPQGSMTSEVDACLQSYGVKSVEDLRVILDGMKNRTATREDTHKTPPITKKKRHHPAVTPAKESPVEACVAGQVQVPAGLKTPTKPKHPDGCVHNDYANFTLYDNAMGYFKSAYLDNESNHWPKECDHCKILFVDKPANAVKKTEYKVTQANCVFLCKNAANSSHTCTFGLCKNCRYEVLGESPSRNKRTRSIFEAS